MADIFGGRVGVMLATLSLTATASGSSKYHSRMARHIRWTKTTVILIGTEPARINVDYVLGRATEQMNALPTQQNIERAYTEL